MIFCGVPFCHGFCHLLFSVLFFLLCSRQIIFFGSACGCSFEFVCRMFCFSLAWLVRSN